MRRQLVALTVVAGLVAIGAGVTLAITRPESAPAGLVSQSDLDRPVPAVPLTDHRGAPTTLADLWGKVVVLSPFMTACREICPKTTGAFLRAREAVRAAGLGDRVVFVEATVDPERDTPARLTAYRDRTGADLMMLTGTAADLDRFWSFFGVYYEKVPYQPPFPTDWYTNRPDTYDIGHVDAVFLIDARGH